MDIDLVMAGTHYRGTVSEVPTEEPGRVITFAQQDDRWRGDTMGDTRQTIGGMGCAMTCAAMVLSQVQPLTNPGDFNRILNADGGYNVYGGTEAHLAWDRLPAIFPELVWDGRKSWRRNLYAAEVEAVLDMIDEAPLILWVDFRPATSRLDTHFVLATAYDAERADVLIHDPWEGVTDWLLERYGGDRYRSLAAVIWGYRRLRCR